MSKEMSRLDALKEDMGHLKPIFNIVCKVLAAQRAVLREDKPTSLSLRV